jgi:molybdopterin synthase catalytic subunit
MEAMQVQVLFFGALKDVVGRAEERIQLEPGSDVGALFQTYSERFPALESHAPSLLFSRNREFVKRSEPLQDGDEVAFLPPVSGGCPAMAEEVWGTQHARFVCRLTREPIDSRALVIAAQQRQDGAVVVFEGIVRDHSTGRPTQFLEYEAYEPMALEKMHEICETLVQQFPVDRIAMVHRLGRLGIGEVSVAIVVTSEHRKAAFQASSEAIDRLKKTVPIWKKEFFVDGAVWVEGEDSRHTVSEKSQGSKG